MKKLHRATGNGPVRRRRPSSAFLMAAAAFASLVSFAAVVSCASRPKPNIHEIFASSPSHHLENYPFAPESSIVSRIAEAPSFLLDYLKEIDDVDSYRPYLPDERERAMLEEYIKELPPLNRSTMKDRLIGIYFIEDFRGSGLMDFVLDEDGGTYAVMVINADSLRTGISEWMTYRESTCFEPPSRAGRTHGGIEVRVDCGSGYTGAMYVLLHESTHVVDIIHGVTPYVEDSLVQLRNLDPPESTPFTKGYWTGYGVPHPKHRRDFMEEVTFYGFGGGPKARAAAAPAIYGSLSETPYASLYSCLSWAEDLAEYVTWHHWTAVMNRPYEITVSSGDDPPTVYRPMENPAVRGRVGTIRAFYPGK